MNRTVSVLSFVTSPRAKKAAGMILTVAGWYVAFVTAGLGLFVLVQFDFTSMSAIPGVFVLMLYVVVLVGLSILLMRWGRRLRAK
jgi:hypothetical protein